MGFNLADVLSTIFENSLEYIASGIVGAFIAIFIERQIKKWRERKGLFSGTWDQKIFSYDGSEVIKEDVVECKDDSESIEAKIWRVLPDDQSYRRWTFSGRFKDGLLFGHFWSEDPLVPSDGVIFLRRINHDKFAGFYMRLDHQYVDLSSESVSIAKIPLEWKRRQEN